MKAILIHGYGDVDTLRYDDVPLPEPEANDVRITVHAAAVNPVDWKIREGYLAQMLAYEMPLILGWDVSGTVDQVGADVTHLSVGDAVYSRPDIARNGSYAGRGSDGWLVHGATQCRGPWPHCPTDR